MSTGLRFGPLADLVGFHLARAAVTTAESFERCIGQPFELGKAEFSLLMVVLANEAVVPRQLARALAMTSPALTPLLDRLQQRGLIRRERNPADGRSQHIVLTPEGRRVAQAAAGAAGPMEAEMQAGRLTRAEHAMLIELLGKLAGVG